MPNARNEQATADDADGPENQLLRYLLETAWNQYRSGEWAAVRELIAAILERHPDSMDALLYAGRIYAGMDGVPAGLPYVRKAKEVSPYHPHVLMLLAWFLYSTGDNEQAVEVVEDILRHDTGWGGRLGAMTYRDYFRGEYEIVVRDLESVPDLARRNPHFAYLLIHSLYNTQRYADAARVCREAVAFDPTDAWAYGCLGWCEKHLRNRRAALHAFENAVRLEPENADHYGPAIHLSIRLLRLRVAWRYLRVVWSNPKLMEGVSAATAAPRERATQGK